MLTSSRGKYHVYCMSVCVMNQVPFDDSTNFCMAFGFPMLTIHEGTSVFAVTDEAYSSTPCSNCLHKIRTFTLAVESCRFMFCLVRSEMKAFLKNNDKP